tara:strand:- start:568 stop:786 length:219 start_codon:yes stop_codon:yes gene_type:complete
MAIGYLSKACGDYPLCSYPRRDAKTFCDASLGRKFSGRHSVRIPSSVIGVINFVASEHCITLVNPFNGIFYA